jgi:hypothetical protein
MPTLTHMQQRILRALHGYEQHRQEGVGLSTTLLREYISKGAHVKVPLEGLRTLGLVRLVNDEFSVPVWKLTGDGRLEAEALGREPERETWTTVDVKVGEVECRLAAVRQLDTRDVETNSTTRARLLRALRDLNNAAYDAMTTANRVADL